MDTHEFYMTLEDADVVDGVLVSLRNKGVHVPQSHYALMSLEPFFSMNKRIPMDHGRPAYSIIKKESPWPDGLRLDLTNVHDGYEQLIVEIGRGPVSKEAIAQVDLGSRLRASDSVHFVRQMEPTWSANVPYIAYAPPAIESQK